MSSNRVDLSPEIHRSDVPVFGTPSDLIKNVAGLFIEDKTVRITDANQARRSMDLLVFNAVDFGETKSAPSRVMTLARYLILEVGRQLGVVPASVFPFYAAIGRGDISRKLTVAAINIRGDAYNAARAMFRAALANRVGAMILELARTEMAYTNQPPAEYAAVMTAAAVREGFRGRLFLQGDHFKVDATRYRHDPDEELQALQNLIRESVGAGFGQIDIDASTLERRGEPGISVEDAVRKNAELTATLTEFIRKTEAEQKIPYTISIGGESGEVGKTNTTVEEYQVFTAILKDGLAGSGIDNGISKISVNTGTAHGGIHLPDGTLAQVNIDFDTLKAISQAARKDGLAGAVQHGASTLPDEVFHRFVEYETVEIHLATGFQDITMDHMPDDLINTLYDWVRENCAGERKPEQTEIQFLLASRKKCWGPNKEIVWRMDQRARGRAAEALEEKFAFLFQQLNLVDTKDLVDRLVPEPNLFG